ncbi:MAG: hypothetical protein WC551_08785 [Patescibacteria group bacterium]
MSLKCDFEVTGEGQLTLDLSEVEDLTPEGVAAWLSDSAHIKVIEQGAFAITLGPRYTPEDLLAAIEAEKREREDDGV